MEKFKGGHQPHGAVEAAEVERAANMARKGGGDAEVKSGGSMFLALSLLFALDFFA